MCLLILPSTLSGTVVARTPGSSELCSVSTMWTRP